MLPRSRPIARHAARPGPVTLARPAAGLPIILAAAFALLPATTVLGQAAVDQRQTQRTDRRVDLNLNRLPAGVDEAAEFRRRNAVVTGNAVGGRGFRGSVGYSSPFDFRGVTGSDDLFEFRADSALSNPALLRSAGSRLRFGEAVGALEFYRTSRGTSGETMSGPTPLSGMDPRGFGPATSREAAAASAYGRIRNRVDQLAVASSLDSVFSRSADLRPIGAGYDPAGVRQTLAASSVQGIQTLLAGSDLAALGLNIRGVDAEGGSGLSVMDTARLAAEARGTGGLSVGFPYRPSYLGLDEADDRLAAGASDRLVSGQADSTRIDGSDRRSGLFGGDGGDARVTDTRSESGRVSRTADRTPEPLFGGGPASTPAPGTAPVATDFGPATPAWERIREEVARRFVSELRGSAAANTAPTESDLSALQADIEQLRASLGGQNRPATNPSARRATGAAVPALADEAVEAVRRVGRILRHGERVDVLVDPSDRTRAGEFIADGERDLRAGNYFRAERTFGRAIRLIPGHPTATIGLAHARIGAGLHVPAALVLGDLFRFQPEMVGATYADGLVPNRPRLLRALESARERKGDEADAAEIGLLLAYLGRLLERPAVIREGLQHLRSAVGANDTLFVLLSEVWLEGAPVGFEVPGADTPG